MKKKLISIFLTLCMVLTLFPVSVFAEGNWEITLTPKQESASAEVQTMMPVQLEGHLAYEPVYAAKSVDEYTDIEQTVKDVRQQMVNRYRYISFPLRVSKSEVRDETELEALIVAIYELALTHTGVADEGDYLLWSLESVEYSVSGEESDTDYDLTVKFEVEYYTRSSEESYVRSQVQSILSGFGFTEETDDYTKIFSIYTFICDTVDYDYDNLANPNYTTQFTAYSALYNGKAVCQGYALLLYYMLLAAGIDCRVISGYEAETGMPHAWNIVQLDGVWYNLDATWDAGYYDYLYFLKSPANFTDHVRDEVYEIPEFHQLYPMAQEDHELTLPAISGGDCGENIQYTIYADGYLEIIGSGDMFDWTDSVAPWNTYSSYVRYVYVDEGIRSIGVRSFRQLPYLLVAELAEGVESIDNYAFHWNERLMGVYIPATVKTVGEYAFYFCNRLFAVVISDLSAWCGIDFDGYYANPLLNGADLYLNEDVITDLVIPDDVTAIKTYAFTGGNFASVTFHSGITEVAPYAFTDCKELKSVYITDLAAWCSIDFSDAEKPWENGNPLALGADLYLNGAKVTKLVIPDGVQRIGNAAFYGSSISAITIPASVKAIGASAFSGCQQLRNVSISDLSAWCSIDFADSAANPLAWYGTLYLNGTQLTNLVIPEGTTAIKDYAFMNGKFYSVTLPAGLKSIGECAFMNTLIKQIELPDGLERIGAAAFKGCEALTTVHTGSGVTKIDWAFSYCNALTDVTFGENLASLSNPFFGCDQIDRITFTGNAPAFEGYGSDFFGLTATIYYPAGNATWTPDVLQNYGGRITWVASCTGHAFENGVCSACGAKDPDFQPDGLKGDADGSGEVDYLDAMIVLQYHTGVVGDDALNLAVCDVDDSGEVDYLDAMILLQYHTGVIPEL